MIKTIKCATNLPELIFICKQQQVMPFITESLFMGLELTKALYRTNEGELALLDSDKLLEVVSYENDAELLSYMKDRQFTVGYKVGRDGRGQAI